MFTTTHLMTKQEKQSRRIIKKNTKTRPHTSVRFRVQRDTNSRLEGEKKMAAAIQRAQTEHELITQSNIVAENPFLLS